MVLQAFRFIFLFFSYFAILEISHAEIINCTVTWDTSKTCFQDKYGYQWKDQLATLKPATPDGTIGECGGLDVGEVQQLDCDLPDVEELSYSTDCYGTGWFKCRNGRCINRGLACNGDDDCGDASDEYPLNAESNCTMTSSNYICGIEITQTTGSTPPQSDRFFLGVPGVEKFSVGFDLLTGKFRGEVLSMRPFGSCRRVLKYGETDYYYRLPNNVNSFSQQFTIVESPGALTYSAAMAINGTKDLLGSDSSFGGLLNKLDSNTGFTQSQRIVAYTMDNIRTSNQYTAVTSQMKVKISRITLKSPAYLEMSSAFIQRLFDLPYRNMSFYAYRQFIQEFGTHYVASGTLGGQYGQTNMYDRCWLEDGYDLEYPKPEWSEQLVFCDREDMRSKLNAEYAISADCMSKTSVSLADKVLWTDVDVMGGSVATSSTLKESLTSANWQAWVDSVSDYPALIIDDFKLERISNLLDYPIPQLTDEQRLGIQKLLDEAIDLYLTPYDAEQICSDETYSTNCRDTACSYATDDPEANFTVRYLAGQGSSTYKCQCACETAPYDVCGSVRELSTLLTFILCMIVTTKNIS